MTREQIISLIVFCIYIAVVCFLCFGKPEDLPQMPVTWLGLPADKVGHFIMFAPFPVLAFLTLCMTDKGKGTQLAIVGVLIVSDLGLATGTELVQAKLAYRTADLNDFIADAAGMAFGGILTALIIIFRKKK